MAGYSSSINVGNFRNRWIEKNMAEIKSESNKNIDHIIDKLIRMDENRILPNAGVDEYFSSIKNELTQIDQLVSNAANNLIINFKYISRLIKSHQNMIMSIDKIAIPEEKKPILGLLEECITISGKIEQELGMAVTSLQFGDLVAQLIAHTIHRVEILSLELQLIDQQNIGKKKTGEKDLHTMHEKISNAVNAANSKNKRKSVVQQGMQIGEIELFKSE